MNARVVVAWMTEAEKDAFVEGWNLSTVPDYVTFQHDANREGCGATKNKGVRRAVEQGADVVIVLDGDCYASEHAKTLDEFVAKHVKALEPQRVDLYQAVTFPPSRGTPYLGLTATRPVAASMGFWVGVPDYCAVRQLAFESKPMSFRHDPIFGKYFPLCGMNVAFRPREWWPWCQFIEVSRYDDIWQGWLWQREAYRRGACFNLDGPTITHSRQSNVWKNLIDEARYAKETETLWQEIAFHETGTYRDLLKLLPTGTVDLDREPWVSGH